MQNLNRCTYCRFEVCYDAQNVSERRMLQGSCGHRVHAFCMKKFLMTQIGWEFVDRIENRCLACLQNPYLTHAEWAGLQPTRREAMQQEFFNMHNMIFIAAGTIAVPFESIGSLIAKINNDTFPRGSVFLSIYLIGLSIILCCYLREAIAHLHRIR
jgi:hypothetical protein